MDMFKNRKAIVMRVCVFLLLVAAMAIAPFVALLGTAASGLTITLDGKPVATDVAPYVDENDRTMVPVRFIGEAFKAKVEWDEGTETVTISKDGTVITLVIGSNQLKKNGTVTKMDTAAVLTDERTFVPVRFIAEALGLTVAWDEATQTVVLTSRTDEGTSSEIPTTVPTTIHTTIVTTTTEAPRANNNATAAVTDKGNVYSYVGNLNSKVFHYSWCVSVDKMKESNKHFFENVTRDEVIAAGYKPCAICTP